MKKLFIGCHLSSSKGFLALGRHMADLGANTCSFFLRSPRGGKARALDKEDMAAFFAQAQKDGLGKLVAHAPYTVNAASDKEDTRRFARDVLRADLERMEYLPGNYYNFHPGNHLRQGYEVGEGLIAKCLNEILRPEQKTTVLLETMAGKGTEVGCRFEQLKKIMDAVELKDKIGVCFDTCHVFDAGYDIVHDLEGVLREFDEKIGLEHLRAVHLNDSKNECGSHKDRHEKIGQGKIGFAALLAVTRHPALRELPFILETPNEDDGYKREIELLRCGKEDAPCTSGEQIV